MKCGSVSSCLRFEGLDALAREFFGAGACFAGARALRFLVACVGFAGALVLRFFGAVVCFPEGRVPGFVGGGTSSEGIAGARMGKRVRRPTHTVSDAVSMSQGGREMVLRAFRR